MSSRVTKSSRRNANCKPRPALYNKAARPEMVGRLCHIIERAETLARQCPGLPTYPAADFCPACPAIRQRLRPAIHPAHGRLPRPTGRCRRMARAKKAADLSRKTIRRSFRISSCGRHCGNPTRYRFASVYPDHRWSLPPGRSPPGANRRGNTADRSRSC